MALRTLNPKDVPLLALWAADCAEHVLDCFEMQRPDDERPGQAIQAARAWAHGDLGVARARVAAFAAHAAARAAGHAAATAHVAAHAPHAARYARAAAADARAERAWQQGQLPERLWALAFPQGERWGVD